MKGWRYRGGEQIWKEQGACAGDAQAQAMLFALDMKTQAEAARRWCTTCPVRQDCLGYAMAHGEQFGVWGGVIESQRRNRRWQIRMRMMAS